MVATRILIIRPTKSVDVWMSGIKTEMRTASHQSELRAKKTSLVYITAINSPKRAPAAAIRTHSPRKRVLI